MSDTVFHDSVENCLCKEINRIGIGILDKNHIGQLKDLKESEWLKSRIRVNIR